MCQLRGFIAVLAACALAGGCAGRVPVDGELDYDAELIDGRAVFGRSIEPAPGADLLAVSDEMSHFVEHVVRPLGVPFSRLERLMYVLEKEGFFVDHYDSTLTTTASETFENRKGNCLAYTNMFVAMARASGLRAFYQVAYVDPVWDFEAGYLVRQNHINVLVDAVHVPGMREGELTVDFNATRPRDSIRRRRVPDEYAAALYHANLAVDHMYKKEYEPAFAHLKRAIQTHSVNVDLWNNLGTLYSVLDRHDYSERAHRTALAINPNDQPAFAGLAKAHKHLGNAEQAARYAELNRRRLANNPYYYFANAELAYREQSFEAALAHVNRAIRLNRRDPKFYVLRAATAVHLGDEELKEKSLAQYHKHSKPKRTQRRRSEGMITVRTPR